ncbi:hypothetical protein AB0399_32030 [Streptomyces sp. NPDC088194]|uniref:hypothetical protein n=1 Tax=Streptomyces sp. NPDC088194 TaxID=3154931 RepID=UPI00344B6766
MNEVVAPTPAVAAGACRAALRAEDEAEGEAEAEDEAEDEDEAGARLAAWEAEPRAVCEAEGEAAAAGTADRHSAPIAARAVAAKVRPAWRVPRGGLGIARI